MTFDETYQSHASPSRLTALARHGARALAARTGAAVKRLQYTRMLSALNQLSDAQLRQIGLARKDIPARARHAVYGDD